MCIRDSENAQGLAALLPAESEQRIGVVTSATHAMRAAQIFAGHFPGDVIVPVPVHYQHDAYLWRIENLRPTVGAFERSTAALHEWIGLLWHRIRH